MLLVLNGEVGLFVALVCFRLDRSALSFLVIGPFLSFTWFTVGNQTSGLNACAFM